jgi:hypothetical protein
LNISVQKVQNPDYPVEDELVAVFGERQFNYAIFLRYTTSTDGKRSPYYLPMAMDSKKVIWAVERCKIKWFFKKYFVSYLFRQNILSSPPLFVAEKKAPIKTVRYGQIENIYSFLNISENSNPIHNLKIPNHFYNWENPYKPIENFMFKECATLTEKIKQLY